MVREYDEAIAWYRDALGFSLLEDTSLGGEKRWVVMSPSPDSGSDGSTLVLARAETLHQATRIGNQTGGRVFLFLHTDDFERDHASMTESGVRFVEDPRDEEYGTVAVFEDLYGNRWDLIQPAGV